MLICALEARLLARSAVHREITQPELVEAAEWLAARNPTEIAPRERVEEQPASPTT
jgi:hypothetical protein